MCESHPIFTDSELDDIVKFHNVCSTDSQWSRSGSSVFIDNSFVSVSNRTLEQVWTALYRARQAA